MWQVRAAIEIRPASSEARKRGALTYLNLDVEGRPSGAPIQITTKPIVEHDFDALRVGNKIVFAWTDSSGLDPEVVITTLAVGSEGNGKVLVKPGWLAVYGKELPLPPLPPAKTFIV